jgi:hypothetical protein
MTDLRSELTGIYQQHGELTPQIVVDEARQEDAPLHGRFEWDDSIAGEKYRLEQAARLIRTVRIEYSSPQSDEKRFIRAFSSLYESGEPERQGYAPTEEVLENPITRKILLGNMQRDINQLKKRYGHLAEFADMMRRAIDGEEDAA